MIQKQNFRQMMTKYKSGQSIFFCIYDVYFVVVIVITFFSKSPLFHYFVNLISLEVNHRGDLNSDIQKKFTLL